MNDGPRKKNCKKLSTKKTLENITTIFSLYEATQLKFKAGVKILANFTDTVFQRGKSDTRVEEKLP